MGIFDLRFLIFDWGRRGGSLPETTQDDAEAFQYICTIGGVQALQALHCCWPTVYEKPKRYKSVTTGYISPSKRYKRPPLPRLPTPVWLGDSGVPSGRGDWRTEVQGLCPWLI